MNFHYELVRNSSFAKEIPSLKKNLGWQHKLNILIPKEAILMIKTSFAVLAET